MTGWSARARFSQHAEIYTDNLPLRSRKEHTKKDIDDQEEETEASSGEDISPDFDAPLHQDLGALKRAESSLIQNSQSRSRCLSAVMSRSPLFSSSTSEDASAYAPIPSLGENTGVSPEVASGKRARRHRSNLESTIASGVGVPTRQETGLFEDIAPLLDNENGEGEAIDVDSEDIAFSDDDPPDNSPLVASLLYAASIIWDGT